MEVTLIGASWDVVAGVIFRNSRGNLYGFSLCTVDYTMNHVHDDFIKK